MDEKNNLIENIREEALMKDTRAKTNIENNEKLINERSKNLINFLKKPKVWVLGFLIVAIILGIYIRSMPMQDHGGNPGLWDIATNTWTLGPDLDPWLFTRYAKIIVEEGSLPAIDELRNVPLGFDTSKETMLLPNMIVWTYHLVNVFGDYNVNFAAAIFPVIMFALTIISFFFFVREIFTNKTKKGKTRANIISLISTFFMIVIPVFLSRTVAGIPEKESAGFFFMFLAFYLFLKGWKSENLKSSIIFGILAGITTAMMRLIWGGVIYIFITLAIASLMAFVLNKVHKKEILLYFSWIFSSFITILIFFSNKVTIEGLLTSLDSGLAFLVFLIFLVHIILWKTKLSRHRYFKNSKIPKNFISIIISLILVIILSGFIFGPNFIIDKIKLVHQTIFKPVVGRWNTTVAENRQPYFTEWGSSFGPFIKNIPLMFWLFFIGSTVLFKKMLNQIKKKDSWILTGLYVLFLLGLIFSRYSSSSLFNGENFISKFVYYGSALLLIGGLIYYYLQYHKRQDRGFEKIKFEYLFLFAFFILALFTSRGAVRLIMVLGTVAPIFVGFLIISSIEKFRKIKDETGKIILGALLILILLASIFTFWTFYQTIKVQSYNMVPSGYNQQWQKAMNWVRKETPENAVFGHWWDYGYWVQSIGERATVLDGGNAASFWNYWMGRLVLTSNNQKEALEFLYSHNTTYFLIDSTDIGKYSAYSSIASDESYDRFSWIGTFLLDEKQTQETQNQTILVYSGGNSLDEDLIITNDGKETLLPRQNAGVGAIIIPTKKDQDTLEFEQPYVIFVYNGQQYKQDLRYIFLNEEVIDFNSGIDAGIFIIPRIAVQSQGVNNNPLGAAMYISPRLMRGMMVQKYILNDPFNNFPNFNLVHTEQNLIIDSLISQGMDLPEFVYYQGIQGPIKIWEIEYTGSEKFDEKYIDKDSSKYISWQL
jgi:asparagine N-glycosylation enzyme membrane subunit Stt3